MNEDLEKLLLAMSSLSDFYHSYTGIPTEAKEYDFIRFLKHTTINNHQRTILEERKWHAPLYEFLWFSKTDKITINKIRQCGASVFFALYAIHMCIINPNFKILILFPNSRQKDGFIDKIKNMENSEIDKNIVWDSEVIKFFNGSRIEMHNSSNNPYIRHLVGNFDVVIVDEAAFHPNSYLEKIEEDATGKVILVSTPNMKAGTFYDWCVSSDTETFKIDASNAIEYITIVMKTVTNPPNEIKRLQREFFNTFID